MKMVIGLAFVSIAVHAAPDGTSGNWVADMREASRLDQSARYADAQAIYDRILRAGLPATGILRAELCNDLAAHYHHLARYADAEPLYRQAIDIWRQTPEDAAESDLALALGNLAALHRAQGKFQAAELLYREELQILERVSKKLSTDCPAAQPCGDAARLTADRHYAIALNNFAELRRSEGNLAGAEAMAREALATSDRVFGPHEENVGVAAHTLAVILGGERKYEEADPLLQRVIEVWKETFGLDHPKVAVALGNLAHIRCEQGRYEEAESLSRQSLEIRRKAFGPGASGSRTQSE